MANKFGLNRDISSEVKREVRQKCGFGCVICGSPIIQYHHFNPPFFKAKSHTVIGITLLCGTCHDKTHKKIISTRRVEEADKAPYCKKNKYTRGFLETANVFLPVQIGSCSINAQSIIVYENDIVFGLSKSNNGSDSISINAMFNNNEGDENIKNS